MIVRVERSVRLQEVEQVRHLLEIRRDARDVAAVVRVVELQVDDVLDPAVLVAEVARAARGCSRRPVRDGAGDERGN
jgi:hypothetical protein